MLIHIIKCIFLIQKKYGGERHTIASTRSLGHRGIFLSYEYSQKIFNLTKPGKYKIIAGSDGIWM